MTQLSQNIQSALNVGFQYTQIGEGVDVMKEKTIEVEINKVPDLLGRYQKAGVAQNQSTIATSEQVKGFKKDASKSIADFCTGLKNIAEDSKDEKLQALVNHPYSYFYQAAKNEFAPRAEYVISGIESYAKTILDKIVSDDDFKVLRDKVALFQKNKDNAKLIRNSKKVKGTAALNKLDKEARNLRQRIINAAISKLPANSDLRNGLLGALTIQKDGTQHNAAELTLQNEDGSLFEGQASAEDTKAKEASIFVVNNKSQIIIPTHTIGKSPFIVSAIGKKSQSVSIEFEKGVTVKIVVVLVDDK